MATANISKPVWEFRHSVDCNAPRWFAWSSWTNIANWNDPPATFQLVGPFAAGSRLTTNLPGQTLHSVIREVVPDREATIDMQLPDAIFSFHWIFGDSPGHHTHITQRLVLCGANAESFVPQVAVLEQTAPEGMKKLAAAIEHNYQLKQ